MKVGGPGNGGTWPCVRQALKLGGSALLVSDQGGGLVTTRGMSGVGWQPFFGGCARSPTKTRRTGGDGPWRKTNAKRVSARWSPNSERRVRTRWRSKTLKAARPGGLGGWLWWRHLLQTMVSGVRLVHDHEVCRTALLLSGLRFKPIYRGGW
jgi:hypothetical protein